MAVVKWGIDHPNNPRNKQNPERSQQLEEERRNFVGTATKGAIRTNPDGTIMDFKSEDKHVETGSEDEQTDVYYMSGEDEPDVKMTAESEEEQEHDNHSTMDGHASSPPPSSVADDTSVFSTEGDDLPPGWLPGILSDGSRFWYTSERFAGPMLKETPTQVPENYVFDEHTQRWVLAG